MKICSVCVLPETFPGISFDEQGVCNFCRSSRGKESLEQRKASQRGKFEALLAEHAGQGAYDALVCYSGGKDSTYTLMVLKEEYSLRIVALTLDNGFLPDQTVDNIKNVTENLGIDHILFKPRFDLMARIFGEAAKRPLYPPKTLERASSICTSCMGILKFSALRLAIEKGIPLIAFGWTPGQAPITSSIMKNNPPMIRLMQSTIFEPMYELCGDAIKPYFLEEKHFEGGYSFPYSVHPLAFLGYNEAEVYNRITGLGWQAPTDTDAHSSNCLLNSFSNVVHKAQTGYHPYAFEMANLVREGYLDRASTLEKLAQLEDQRIVTMVREKLELAGGFSAGELDPISSVST